MSEKMPGMEDDILEENEAEMVKRMKATIERPDFLDTHFMDKSGNIIPKGENWDRA